MNETNGQPTKGGLLSPSWLPKEARFHGISSQDYIITTEDRLHRRIHEHSDAVDGSRNWLLPFSVLIAVLLALVTAKFEDFILTASVWQAIFIIVAIGSGAICIWQWIKKRRCPTIEDLVEKIKETSQGNNPK